VSISIDEYDSQRYPAIAKICQSQAIPYEVRIGLQSASERLRSIKLGADSINTPAQNRKKLLVLAQALQSSLAAFDDIEPTELANLDQIMGDESDLISALNQPPIAAACKNPAVYFEPCSSPVVEIIRHAKRCVELAAGDKPITGRKPVIHLYGACVLEAAYHLQAVGILLGRGGTFEEICDALWRDAGYRPSAEGAIRYVLEKMQDEYRTYGVTLSNGGNQ
jgi:hypothetical protein